MFFSIKMISPLRQPLAANLKELQEGGRGDRRKKRGVKIPH
jgi:hypothetical protein